jgi:hypothetical protein
VEIRGGSLDGRNIGEPLGIRLETSALSKALLVQRYCTVKYFVGNGPRENRVTQPMNASLPSSSLTDSASPIPSTNPKR